MTDLRLADPGHEGSWLNDPVHRRYLRADAERQVRFFALSLRGDGGFDALDHDAQPLLRQGQELHTTTRLVHSFALASAAGFGGTEEIVDAGMRYLWSVHRDPMHGGYLWAVDENGVHDGTKLAYGHVFVLLAASSAALIGHPLAPALMEDILTVLDTRFSDGGRALFQDEFTRDWQVFSDYRGMNANMHGTEALLAAYEATGDRRHLDRAGDILDFFTRSMAGEYGNRIPEHYTSDWEVDPDYSGNPMFRPAGTTPGHSLEFARLVLHHWDLAGRPAGDTVARARALVTQALSDAWREDGGLVYTLNAAGGVAIPDRYWWPVTEGIGALASLLKIGADAKLEAWYRRLWKFAHGALIDRERGGWYPELGEDSRPVSRQFIGKPDIYHALQADLLPLAPGLSRSIEGLRDRRGA